MKFQNMFAYVYPSIRGGLMLHIPHRAIVSGLRASYIQGLVRSRALQDRKDGVFFRMFPTWTRRGEL